MFERSIDDPGNGHSVVFFISIVKPSFKTIFRPASLCLNFMLYRNCRYSRKKISYFRQLLFISIISETFFHEDCQKKKYISFWKPNGWIENGEDNEKISPMPDSIRDIVFNVITMSATKRTMRFKEMSHFPPLFGKCRVHKRLCQPVWRQLGSMRLAMSAKIPVTERENLS